MTAPATGTASPSRELRDRAVYRPGRTETAVRTAPALDVVVPVYNEATDLEQSVRRLHEHLESLFPYSFRITIADNASTDDTLAIAQRLA